MESLLEKIKVICPEGYCGGDIQLIVGPSGFVVERINADGSKQQVRLKEDDTVSLVQIVDNKLEVCKNGSFSSVKLLPSHFKGYKRQIKIN